MILQKSPDGSITTSFIPRDLYEDGVIVDGVITVAPDDPLYPRFEEYYNAMSQDPFAEAPGGEED